MDRCTQSEIFQEKKPKTTRSKRALNFRKLTNRFAIRRKCTSGCVGFRIEGEGLPVNLTLGSRVPISPTVYAGHASSLISTAYFWVKGFGVRVIKPSAF